MQLIGGTDMERVLRSIMIAGSGIILVGTLGKFICIGAFPLVSDACTKYTTEIENYLSLAGFRTLGQVTAGFVTLYFISGRWKLN